jgi:superoxide dismutase, Fe-Mn family
MEHKLPDLPYAIDALAPSISRETLEYHHGKHHAAYVNNLNKLIKDTEFEFSTIEEIVKKANGGIYNNAAQAWNHAFYWQSLSPAAGGEPAGTIAEAIRASFGSFAAFREEFTKSAMTTFGSGWVWLVKNGDGKLLIESMGNAGTPLKNGKKAILTCDVWEHAYYIDYRNNRAAYIEAFWKLVNWKFAEQNLQ